MKDKGYGNTSEYLRTLVRNDQEVEAAKRLERLLLEGLESGGDDIAVDERFWSELRAEAAALVKKRRKLK